MSELKYFTRNGNQYTMKKQLGFNFVVIGGMLGATILGVYIDLPAMSWVCGILTVIVAIALYLKRVVIDMDNRSIFIKSGLIQPGIQIPFNDFVTFQLASIRHYFITTNTSLNLLFMKNGKERSLAIATGFTVKAMQRVLNEIEEIIYPDEHSGRI